MQSFAIVSALMRTRWEYLFVFYTYETNWATKSENAKQTWNHKILVSYPDGTTISVPEGAKWVSLFQKWGQEGWELVSDVVLDTKILNGLHGWNEVGTPVETRFIFKRPIA